MDFKCTTSSSSLTPKTQIKIAKITPNCEIVYQKRTEFASNSGCMIKRHHISCQWKQKKANPWSTQRIYAKKEEEEESLIKVEVEPRIKQGTIAGAVALIIGTCIGSGILALPQKAYPAGVFPSSISLIICWAFLLIEALLIIEINVGLRIKMRKSEEESEFEVISLRTMAQETLGDFGGTLATVTCFSGLDFNDCI